MRRRWFESQRKTGISQAALADFEKCQGRLIRRRNMLCVHRGYRRADRHKTHTCRFGDHNARNVV